MNYWKQSPRGANMCSEVTENDLIAAKQYGINLIRLGAVGSPGDFYYLLKNKFPNDEWDLSESNLLRLKRSVEAKTNLGFKVILSLAHIPGRNWAFRKRDYRLWQNPKYQDQLIQAWRKIAETLKENSNIVGYELLNEPYLESHRSTAALMSLYKNIISEIRKVDFETPIIIDSADMAAVSEIINLEILSDVKTVYSFHYYEPFPYWSAQLNKGNYKYPGMIPSFEEGSPTNWDRKRHLEMMKVARDWQVANKIENHRIFVGEFGVWRKARGSEQYLKDITAIFKQFGWSWAYYAFREEDWGNADLELTPSGQRKQTSLFSILKEEFQ